MFTYPDTEEGSLQGQTLCGNQGSGELGKGAVNGDALCGCSTAQGDARVRIHFSRLPSCPYFGDQNEVEMLVGVEKSVYYLSHLTWRQEDPGKLFFYILNFSI